MVKSFVLPFLCCGLILTHLGCTGATPPEPERPTSGFDRFTQAQLDGYPEGLMREDRQALSHLHHIFYERQRQTWLANRWMGVQTSQNPNDVWITQEILFEQKPDFMVEAGTKHGGSALIWAMVLREVNPDARVITIDIEDRITDARKVPIFKERIDFLHGSSTDPEIIDEIKRRVAGKKVVVLLDSDHSKDHVLAEMRAYAPIVSVGSYLIVQDGILGGHPINLPSAAYKGPYEAIEAFLASNDDFEVDRSRERLMFTYCPKGYLKRVK